ncbi:MAG: hypothetical protein Alpg2KO_31360 [Alphaproteobacteria bacterium]
MFGPFVMLLMTGVLMFNGEELIHNWELGTGWSVGLFALCMMLIAAALSWGFSALARGNAAGLGQPAVLVRLWGRSLSVLFLSGMLVIVSAAMLTMPAGIIATEIEGNTPEIAEMAGAKALEAQRAARDAEQTAELTEEPVEDAAAVSSIQTEAAIDATAAAVTPGRAVLAKILVALVSLLAMALGMVVGCAWALSLPLVAQDPVAATPMRQVWHASRGHRWKLGLPVIVMITLVAGVAWAEGVIAEIGASLPLAESLKAVLFSLGVCVWMLGADRFIRNWRRPDLPDLQADSRDAIEGYDEPAPAGDEDTTQGGGTHAHAA